MSKTSQEHPTSPAPASLKDIGGAESLDRPAEDSHHLVSQIWSDATLLVHEFNRSFHARSESSNAHVVNLEIEAGLMRLRTELRAVIGFDLRLELEYKRNPPQMISTLRQMEPNGSTGPLILCDSLRFVVDGGMATLTRPDGSLIASNEAARVILEPLFNRIVDAL